MKKYSPSAHFFKTGYFEGYSHEIFGDNDVSADVWGKIPCDVDGHPQLEFTRCAKWVRS